VINDVGMGGFYSWTKLPQFGADFAQVSASARGYSC
jgi:hypothetical protein